jgi:RNA polymerase sigma-70 factor (ECF subfamily)
MPPSNSAERTTIQRGTTMALAAHEETRTDEELVEAFKNGDERAFEEIFRRHSSSVLTYCTYFFKNRQEGEDVSQKVWVRIWGGLKRFRAEAKLSTWIARVQINTCRTHARWWRRLISRFTEMPEPAALVDHRPSPEQISSYNDMERTIVSEIHHLDPRFREAILLSRQGHGMAEMAEIMNIPVNTAKTRLFRAREALRRREPVTSALTELPAARAAARAALSHAVALA